MKLSEKGPKQNFQNTVVHLNRLNFQFYFCFDELVFKIESVANE